MQDKHSATSLSPLAVAHWLRPGLDGAEEEEQEEEEEEEEIFSQCVPSLPELPRASLDDHLIDQSVGGLNWPGLACGLHQPPGWGRRRLTGTAL